MRFNIMAVDPLGYHFAHFLDDALKLLMHGLRSLGHDCTIRRNHVELGRINIIIGGHLFTSPKHVEAVAKSGPYVAIQGEVITPEGLNRSQAVRHYDTVYLPYLRQATAVWDGIPQNIPILHDLDIPACLLLGGYHPAMREVIHREKDIDFLYYGSLTDHREKMLAQLRDRGYQVKEVFDDRSIFRNDLIARTKVNLCPKQGSQMEQLPWTRICFLLNNRSLTVVEQCQDQEWLQDCFPWAPTDQWADLCEQMLHHPRIDDAINQFSDRFEAMPFTEKLEAVLDASLSKMAA